MMGVWGRKEQRRSCGRGKDASSFAGNTSLFVDVHSFDLPIKHEILVRGLRDFKAFVVSSDSTCLLVHRQWNVQM